METISQITIPTDYAAIFIFAYALATFITYKLMKGAKEADRKIF